MLDRYGGDRPIVRIERDLFCVFTRAISGSGDPLGLVFLYIITHFYVYPILEYRLHGSIFLLVALVYISCHNLLGEVQYEKREARNKSVGLPDNDKSFDYLQIGFVQN